MAKKKQAPIVEQDKVFQVIPRVYELFDWPLNWENEDRDTLEEMMANAVSDQGYWPNSPQDFVLHETLNSFKGNSDNLKAFLFLDTADNGDMVLTESYAAIKPIKGTLVVIMGYDYSFNTTQSAKRRVLELIF